MAWGLRPQAMSWVDRRWEKVVFPEEEGPAIITKRTSFPRGDLSGDVADGLFHQRFLRQNHLGGFSFGDQVVDVADVGDAQCLRPAFRAALCLEDLVGGGKGRHGVGLLLAGQPQQEAVFKLLQGKPFEIAGVRRPYSRRSSR